MNKKNTTILLSVFLGLFLLGGLWYFNFRDQNKLSTQEVAQKAVDYINNNLLSGEFSASLVSVSEKEGVVEVSLSIADMEYTSYVTKNGNLFFVEGIDLNKDISIVREEIQREDVKSERPKIQLFVMSYCPYGLQAQKVFLPVYELLGDKADMNIRFVDYIMHEKGEIDENLRQYCIQKEEKEKYDDYLGCFVEEGSYDEENFEICLERANINQDKMNTCVVETDQAYNIYSQYEDQSTWLSGIYPRFDIDSDLNEQYGIGGSPTLVINGSVVKDFKRTPEGLKLLVCDAFINQPEECSQTLSDNSFEPGFGLEETEISSVASCQ